MNKVLKISLIILCLIILGYFLTHQNNKSKIQTTNTETGVVDYETGATKYEYKNKEKGFSLQVPSPRKFQENVFGSLVVLFAPQQPGDMIKENLGIVTVELTGDTDLNKYYENAKSILENVTTDFSLQSKENIKINDIDAIKIIYNGTSEDKKLRREQVFFIKGKTTYIFTYTATQDTFPDFVQEVNDIISSFILQN